ncbi:sentrin-specific protease 2-like [Phaenicophaeus curvirostris]|uniref:sentrin-specific protease 2-like n=1 Tax=Phaenicophaeus curvirostris TaxID=33595 RepID=UPI0037F0A547
MTISSFGVKPHGPCCCIILLIVNFYMHLLMERSKKQGYPAVHALDVSFYSELSSQGHAAAKRWTTGVDLFEHDVVLVPVYQNFHLTLAVIDMREKTIKYLDSASFNSGIQICETLFKYLQEESWQKRQRKLACSEWTVHGMRANEIPQQQNGDDCGVFVCKYADYIARGKPLTFTQSDMPYFRKRMVWEIIHQQLL